MALAVKRERESQQKRAPYGSRTESSRRAMTPHGIMMMYDTLNNLMDDFQTIEKFRILRQPDNEHPAITIYLRDIPIPVPILHCEVMLVRPSDTIGVEVRGRHFSKRIATSRKQLVEQIADVMAEYV